VSRIWRNWYQNDVDEEIKGVDSRDMLKHTEINVKKLQFIHSVNGDGSKTTKIIKSQC